LLVEGDSVLIPTNVQEGVDWLISGLAISLLDRPSAQFEYVAFPRPQGLSNRRRRGLPRLGFIQAGLAALRAGKAQVDGVMSPTDFRTIFGYPDYEAKAAPFVLRD
jgi:hypothetical protein